MEAPAALQPGLPDTDAPAFDDALYKSDAFRMSSMKVGGPAGALYRRRPCGAERWGPRRPRPAPH